MGEEFSLPGQGRRNREAAIADHLSGDPLADLCFRQWVERQGEVGMGMDVDKARGEDPSGPVDLARGGFTLPRLDGRYASVTDGDIDRSRRASAAVDDSGITRPCCTDQQADAVSLSSPAFRRCGQISGVPAPACGSGPRRRRSSRWPDAGPCASATRRRSPA